MRLSGTGLKAARPVRGAPRGGCRHQAGGQDPVPGQRSAPGGWGPGAVDEIRARHEAGTPSRPSSWRGRLQRETGRKIAVVLDNARFHHAKALTDLYAPGHNPTYIIKPYEIILANTFVTYIINYIFERIL